jgi:uncharacterized protein YndB with AHSA1/START domain
MSDEHGIVVQVTHAYAHAPERVFDAWLNPQVARRFLFATATGEVVRCDLDPRVGGKFVVVDRRDGVDVEHTGTWLIIDRPRRLQFTFGVPAFSPDFDLVTIEIAATETGCRLTLTTEMKPEWAAHLDRARNGWTTMLQGLEQSLAQPAD